MNPQRQHQVKLHLRQSRNVKAQIIIKSTEQHLKAHHRNSHQRIPTHLVSNTLKTNEPAQTSSPEKRRSMHVFEHNVYDLSISLTHQNPYLADPKK
mmetsp:Transcript_14688/g.19533  ORF Transcript_14688/g.19533 Transcript_14688/m.19533 type:complete len:96 (-) Transcript_14688:256-543(-)